MIDIDIIEAQAAKATPGPWQIDRGALGGVAIHPQIVALVHGRGAVTVAYTGQANPNEDADIAFLRATRTDVPALCAEVREQRDRLGFVEGKVAALGDELRASLERERILRAELAIVATETGGVWLWQGMGDDPASLSCPVVMSADTLRAFVEQIAKRALGGEP